MVKYTRRAKLVKPREAVSEEAKGGSGFSLERQEDPKSPRFSPAAFRPYSGLSSGRGCGTESNLNHKCRTVHKVFRPPPLSNVQRLNVHLRKRKLMKTKKRKISKNRKIYQRPFNNREMAAYLKVNDPELWFSGEIL